MKNTFKILFCLLMILMLFGCKAQNDQPDSGEVETKQEPDQDVNKDKEIIFDEVDESEFQEKRYIDSEIRIRKDASASGEILGPVQPGEYYEVLESKKDDKYTWYKIDEDKWIADDGTWTYPAQTIKFKSNNGTKEERFQDYSEKQNEEYLDFMTLEKNKFETPDYVFVGWNTKPDGTGTYFSEDEYIKDVVGQSKGICLYAQWQPVINNNFCVKAEKDIELLERPSMETRYIRGILKKGDCFEIYEQINYEGKTWDRIATDIWFVESEDSYSTIESIPEIDIHVGAFDKPTKFAIDSSIATLSYKGDELVSIQLSDPYYGSTGNDQYFHQYPGLIPEYDFGPGVTTTYDNSGRIIEQSYVGHSSTIHRSYIYDDKNRIISIDIWYKSPGDSGNLEFYEYSDDGKLIKQFSDSTAYNNRYTYGDEFEYNGNLVFNYYSFYSYCEEFSSFRGFQQLFRYDSSGRLIQIYYPESPQITGPMISNYYYD